MVGEKHTDLYFPNPKIQIPENLGPDFFDGIVPIIGRLKNTISKEGCQPTHPASPQGRLGGSMREMDHKFCLAKPSLLQQLISN